MPINAQFLTNKGTLSPEWKKDDQFHIFAKTVTPQGESRDLVFLSGYADPSGWTVVANEWLRDTLIMKFDDIRWDVNPEVQVVSIVTPATISNMDTRHTDIVGWGVDYTNYEVKVEPNGTFSTIHLISNMAICGADTYFNRTAYYLVAIGNMRK